MHEWMTRIYLLRGENRKRKKIGRQSPENIAKVSFINITARKQMKLILEKKRKVLPKF